MEETTQRNSLIMKYTRKSLNTMPSNSREDPTLMFAVKSKDISNDAILQSDDKTLKSNVASIRTKSPTIIQNDSQKHLEELKRLRTALIQENVQHFEDQKQISVLQEKLDQQQFIIKDQEHQLMNLKKSLSMKEKLIEELHATAKVIDKSAHENKELNQLKETFVGKDCSFSEFRFEVLRLKKEFHELDVALKEERRLVATNTEEIAVLNKQLADGANIEKELENSLSDVIADNKKLKEELKFLITNVNKEKEDLKQNFESFKDATVGFLEHCKKHRTVLEQIAEDTKRFV